MTLPSSYFWIHSTIFSWQSCLDEEFPHCDPLSCTERIHGFLQEQLVSFSFLKLFKCQLWTYCAFKSELCTSFLERVSGEARYLFSFLFSRLECLILLFIQSHLLFVFGCAGSSLLCAGFLWLGWAGEQALLFTEVCRLRCGTCPWGFLQALGARASVVWPPSWVRTSSSGAWADLLCCTWDLPDQEPNLSLLL